MEEIKRKLGEKRMKQIEVDEESVTPDIKKPESTTTPSMGSAPAAEPSNYDKLMKLSSGFKPAAGSSTDSAGNVVTKDIINDPNYVPGKGIVIKDPDMANKAVPRTNSAAAAPTTKAPATVV
jgi:hypothetical protein